MTLLSRLAAQAMGEPPAVRPVIASRFHASRVGGVDHGAAVGAPLEQETTGGTEAADASSRAVDAATARVAADAHA